MGPRRKLGDSTQGLLEVKPKAITAATKVPPVGRAGVSAERGQERL